MFIDSIVATALVAALYKGWSKGIIVAVFAIISYIVGLAAAMKCSAAVAERIAASTGNEGKWLPLLSFSLVFAIVILLVRLGAKALQKSAKFLMLGWLNTLGGVLFYVFLYCFIISVLLFYATQLHLLSAENTAASVSYPILQPLGPKVIEGLGNVIPVFKGLFTQLQEFFGGIPI